MIWATSAKAHPPSSVVQGLWWPPDTAIPSSIYRTRLYSWVEREKFSVISLRQLPPVPLEDLIPRLGDMWEKFRDIAVWNSAGCRIIDPKKKTLLVVLTLQVTSTIIIVLARNISQLFWKSHLLNHRNTQEQQKKGAQDTRCLEWAESISFVFFFFCTNDYYMQLDYMYGSGTTTTNGHQHHISRRDQPTTTTITEDE